MPSCFFEVIKLKLIDSETRHNDVNYKAIGAHGSNAEEYFYFAQPIDSQLKSHRSHDKALNVLLDREFEDDEDSSYREISLEPSYE